MNEKDDYLICYLIWSYEHEAWWKPRGRGYTRDWFEAGLYTKDEAERICAEANRYNAQPQECMVHLGDLDSFTRCFTR